MKQDNVSTILARIAKQLVESGKRARKRHLETGREVMKYGYAPDYNFEYTKQAPNTFFKAKVALTAEYFALVGPYLFPTVPRRLLTPRPWADDAARARTAILSDLLNYTPTETKLRDECRRAIIEALGYGRGLLWTGRDPKSGLIVSMYDSVRNFIDDPNARTPRERNFVIRRRIRPRFEWLRDYPEQRELIQSEPVFEMRNTDIDGTYTWEAADSAAECICVYEIYAKVGLHNFKGGSDLALAVAQAQGQAITKEQAKQVQLDDSPRKYCVTESGRLLSISEWEVPFFEDDEFPCTEVDFYENPDSIYPVSPLDSALGWQRAINWIVTMMISKYRFTSRTIGALAKGAPFSDKDKDKILVGADMEFLELKLGTGDTRKLSDLIHQFQWSSDWLTAGMELLNLVEEKYKRASGMNDVLTAQPQRAMRSAQEAQLLERNSRTRVDDMRDKVIEWQTRVARKEAMASRFLLSRQDVGSVLGMEAAQAWGFLVEGEADPGAMAEQYMQAGLPPAEAMELAQQQATQAVSLDAWRKEIDYSIEAGSMRRKDVEQRVTALSEMMNQTVPTQLQSADFFERAMAYDTMAEYYYEIGASDDLIAKQKEMAERLRQMGMMPPPMPAPATAAPQPQEVMQ